MADVFISYASVDRAVAERIARAIEKSGLSVWWDRHIKGGAEFSRDIEEHLESATKILVLWSKEAVNSRWVKDEASVAVDTGRLVAATIDGTPAPLGFRQFQTIDLKRWTSRGTAIPRELAEALDGEPRVAPEPIATRRRVPKVAIAGALLAAVAAGIAIVRPPPFDQLWNETQDKTVALAIMPFVTQGGADNDYLGAGLSSALADSLAPLSGLRITSSTSTHALSGKGLTAPDIAKRLAITHLVEGNVQQTGDRLAISVRLIEAVTSEQIWARAFDGGVEELQRLKSQMARELAGALRARLGAGEGDVAERGKVDPKAYEAYLRALERVSVRDDRDARVEAIKQFRLAASIQPDFADAHAGHAYLTALSLPRHVGMSWRELISRQHRATVRALELDPDNDMAWVARAMAFKNFEGKVDEALAIDQAVLKRSPNFGPAHYSMAGSLWMRGRPREALDHLEQAIDGDPFDTLLQFYRAKILYSLGDYEAVRDAAKQCPQRCAGVGWFWLLSMAGFATADIYREDYPLLLKSAVDNSVSPQVIADGRGIIEAFIFGRDYPLDPIDEGEYAEFSDAAIDSRMSGFDAGLRTARLALENAHSDSILDILNQGRVTFSPEQRADPRYHALFRHPKLARIAVARRKEGVTAGLPIFPVKPYTGR